MLIAHSWLFLGSMESFSKQSATLETQTQTQLLVCYDSQKLRLRLRFQVTGCLQKLAIVEILCERKCTRRKLKLVKSAS